MSNEVSGEVEAVGSRNDGEFGILLDDDEWYNGHGDRPDLGEGDEVTLEFELTMNDGDKEFWLVDDHDSITVDSKTSSSSGSGTQGTKDDRAVSRQSAAKTVGNMFQGDAPDGAEDLLKRYRMIEDISHFNIRGEWPDRVEKGQMAVGEDIPDDLEDKIEDLSSRIGSLEQEGVDADVDVSGKADVDDFNSLEDRISDLEEQVSNMETLLENTQEGMKSLKEEIQDQDVIFDGEKEDEDEEESS